MMRVDSEDFSESSPQPIDVMDGEDFSSMKKYSTEVGDEREGEERTAIALAKVHEIDSNFAFRLASHLREDFHLTKPILTDICIRLSSSANNSGEGSQQYNFHKFVLTCSSGYFRDLITKDPTIGKHKIPFDTIKAPIFDLIAESLYTGRVEIANVQNANSLLKACYLLQIKYGESQCANYLTENLNIDNCLDIWLSSKFSNQKGLMDLATAMIGRHLTTVSNYETFLQLDPETIGCLLDDDNLQISNERIVYESAMKWIKYDLLHRQRDLSHILKVIRFQYLNRNYLATVVGAEELILENHDAMHTFSQALRYKLGSPNPKVKVKKCRHKLTHAVKENCETLAKEQRLVLLEQHQMGNNMLESWLAVHVVYPIHFFQKRIWDKYITNPLNHLILGGSSSQEMSTNKKRNRNIITVTATDKNEENRRRSSIGNDDDNFENIPIIPKIGLFERCIVRPLAKAPCMAGDDSDDELDDEDNKENSKDDDVVTPVVLFDDDEKATLHNSVWTKISDDNDHTPRKNVKTKKY